MKTEHYLARIKGEFYVVTNEEPVAGSWMADQNNVYEVPDIDGFIGFMRVVASTKELKGLPRLYRSDLSGRVILNNPLFQIWKIELNMTSSYKVLESKLIIRNGYVSILNISDVR